MKILCPIVPLKGFSEWTTNQKLKQPLDENHYHTQKEQAEELGVVHPANFIRLHRLGRTQKVGCWVPYCLPRKQSRMLAMSMLSRFKYKNFLHKIVTGEKVILCDNLKRQKSWTRPGEASESTAKPNTY